MTREEFLEPFLPETKELVAKGWKTVEPCSCGLPECKGWKFVSQPVRMLEDLGYTALAAEWKRFDREASELEEMRDCERWTSVVQNRTS